MVVTGTCWCAAATFNKGFYHTIHVTCRRDVFIPATSYAKQWRLGVIEFEIEALVVFADLELAEKSEKSKKGLLVWHLSTHLELKLELKKNFLDKSRRNHATSLKSLFQLEVRASKTCSYRLNNVHTGWTPVKHCLKSIIQVAWWAQIGWSWIISEQ